MHFSQVIDSAPSELRQTPRSTEVAVFALNAGILKTQTQHILKNTRIGTPLDIPIPFFLIQHGRDWIAFDTGFNRQTQIDPVGYWGKEVGNAFTPVIAADQEFREAIKCFELEPRHLSAVICSHGHLDHAGAIDNFVATDVPIYFQRIELDEIKRVVEQVRRGTPYIPEDFRTMSQLNIQEIDGVFDLFGDGSIIAFPTPGHSLGHQSLYVRPSQGNAFIYCADALYMVESMDKMIEPAIAADVPGTMQNLNWFKLAQNAGLGIVPSHDPSYWSTRQWAPAPFVP